MRILVLNGSPKKNSNSMFLVRYMLGMVEGDVKTVDLAKKSIQPCLACGSCQKSGQCVLDGKNGDDMHRIRRDIPEADLLILASPIHFSGLSAYVSCFMSRLQPEWLHPDDPADAGGRKKAALVLTAGSLYPNMFEAARISAAAMFRTLNRVMVGMLTAAQTDAIPIDENFEALARAEALAIKVLQ